MTKSMLAVGLLWLASSGWQVQVRGDEVASGQRRPADNPKELRYWLENMAVHHHFSLAEIEAVTGLVPSAIQQRLTEFGIPETPLIERPKDRLFVLPYPGGRHPRIGFREGAIAPQRDTKLSVFCPWDAKSYVVLDVPAAIWSDLGLTYLAHTHIDTIWTRTEQTLEPLEWQGDTAGYYSRRRLPNGIEFGVQVIPQQDHLEMSMWLKNGTDATLTDLRVQNCIMLKGAEGFEAQSNSHKFFDGSYAYCRASGTDRWIITAWDPLHRNWGNEKCPCLHSDPKFDDCQPGETQWLRGWLSFYEGADIQAELERIENLRWREREIRFLTSRIQGTVVDAETGQLLPSRLYVQNVVSGEYFFAEASDPAGSAIIYDKSRSEDSIERHTTLSPHAFALQLPPGEYRLTAIHGQQYLPASQVIRVPGQQSPVELRMQRIVDMSKRGWYSGDTHVHRELDELPNLLLAEDLNVALPLVFWVRDSRETPRRSSEVSVVPEPVYVDERHVYYPMNTEYEIFTVDGQRHTQGAVFVLHHQQPFDLAAPPVEDVARDARKQGALLDLDKHSWNWSAMIVPMMNVDLFELSNNHHWRTNFGFPNWTLENAPQDWPEIEFDTRGFTERGWTEFGFQSYYSFLNCGFRMRVSAGTASGVHPVPLGYGRVYAHVSAPFSLEAWMASLNAGHSFVSQGPLLDLRFNGELPGTTWTHAQPTTKLHIQGDIFSANPLTVVEVIRNGIAESIGFNSEPLPQGGFQTQLDEQLELSGSVWLAVRCFENTATSANQNKTVFAHTNPVFVDVPELPLYPRERDVRYFLERTQAELIRNQDILSESALEEYRRVEKVYQRLLQSSRNSPSEN
ncbi:MAG: CehA/McbA family metallohydrolase [bacterium]|nr:CehA/McbA family metallohydrolase [bacterium]